MYPGVAARVPRPSCPARERLRRAGCAAAIAACWMASARAQTPASLTLDEALARALDANRTIQAARVGRAIDVAGIRVAGQRPNPDVSVEEARDAPHLAIAGAIPIEVAGKRGKRIAAAEATLAVTEAEIVQTTVQVRSDVRRAYYQAVASTRRLAIAQELETIAARLRDAARDRFQTGAAPRLEQLQAELALAQAGNDTASARGDLTASRAALNTLLAYPPDAAPALADPLEVGPLPTVAQATSLALTTNTELKVLERQIDEARARLALAQANRHPDPSVTGTLTYDAPGEFTFGWRYAVAIALPVFTTGKPEVAVAQATLDRAIAQRDARATQIAGDVAGAAARAASARQALERYQTQILPASVQVEQMAEESYRSGQTGLSALLQAVQTAREIRQRALQAGLEYQTALADLERAVGSPIR